MESFEAWQYYTIMNRSNQEKLDNMDYGYLNTADFINEVQNERNSFVNITKADIEAVQDLIVARELNYEEAVQLLVDLRFV